MLDKELQIQIIKDKMKKVVNLNERLRLNVAYLYFKDYNLSITADVLSISYNTAKSYLEDYLNDNKTNNLPRGGSKEMLSDEQSKDLESHLKDKTYLKCQEIITYIQELYNITYTKSGIIKWLKRHKFVYKKPIQYPAKLDTLKQKDFIKFYDDLKSNLPDKEEILFLDSVHPQHQSQAVYGWIKKGHKLAIPTTAKQFRVHYVGAININNPSTETITQSYDTVNAQTIINFLKKISQFYPNKNKLHIILDNASYHKGKEVKEYLYSQPFKVERL